MLVNFINFLLINVGQINCMALIYQKSSHAPAKSICWRWNDYIFTHGIAL